MGSHMTAQASIQTSIDKRRRLAQAGLISRGVLYCLIGITTVQIALGGSSSEQASQSGALETISQQPGGTFLVALVGVGLVAYAAWRAVQFFTEPGDEDSDSEVKDKVLRASYLVRAVIYLGLAFVAFSTAFGGGSSGGGGGTTQLTATVMKDVPGGVLLVGLVGLIIVGVGIYQGYKSFTSDFMEELRQEELDPNERKWIDRIGTAGHAARAIVYVLIGILTITAAVQFDPQDAQGLSGAIQTLSQQPFGPYLLILVALGLILFGTYAIVRARYVDVSE